MYLISHELDHLYTFHNPLNQSNLSFERIDVAISHLKVTLGERQWCENVRMAWSVTPALACYLFSRFPYEPVLREIQRLVKSQPERVLHLPAAANFLVTDANIANDSAELSHLLIWSRQAVAINVLAYFARSPKGHFLTNSILAQYACKNLMASKPETLLAYIPQLVQALRADDYGYVREVIYWLAEHSQLLAHQLIWNMTTNVYRDQDAKIKG